MHKWTDPTTCKTKQDNKTIAQLCGHKPTMLASSVQAVVATAQRVFTLVLLVKKGNQLNSIYLEKSPFKKAF